MVEAKVFATVTSIVSTASSACFSDAGAAGGLRQLVAPRDGFGHHRLERLDLFPEPSMAESCAANCAAGGVAAARNPRP